MSPAISLVPFHDIDKMRWPSSFVDGVRHSASNTAGEATNTHTHFAREVATFSRLELYKNSIPRGASAWLEVVIE